MIHPEAYYMPDYETLILDRQEQESHPDLRAPEDTEFCPRCGDFSDHSAGPCENPCI